MKQLVLLCTEGREGFIALKWPQPLADPGIYGLDNMEVLAVEVDAPVMEGDPGGRIPGRNWFITQSLTSITQSLTSSEYKFHWIEEPEDFAWLDRRDLYFNGTIDDIVGELKPLDE